MRLILILIIKFMTLIIIVIYVSWIALTIRNYRIVEDSIRELFLLQTPFSYVKFRYISILILIFYLHYYFNLI